MLHDERAKPILDRWKKAHDAEAAAIEKLRSALASGERNDEVLLKLTAEMESACQASTSIYNELEAVRLDKGGNRG